MEFGPQLLSVTSFWTVLKGNYSIKKEDIQKKHTQIDLPVFQRSEAIRSGGSTKDNIAT